MMQIKRGNVIVTEIVPSNSSNVSRAVMGEEKITLSYEVPHYTELLIGDYIVYEGAHWTLNSLPTVKKVSAYKYRIDAEFESTRYDLSKTIYLLFDSADVPPKGEFTLTGQADLFMELLVANLNRVSGPGIWSVGDVVADTPYITLSFSNEDCLTVLGRLADEFDTEYHINGNIVHLERKSTERLVTLEYGSTLYDIERSAIDQSSLCTRLYPYGSTKNLPTDYRGGNMPLCLPTATGQYLEQNTVLYGIIENSKTFEEIYPRLELCGAGVVTAVDTPFIFSDSAINFNVNDYLLAGTPAKVHFTTGQCAGYDFEIKNFNLSTKTFTIIAVTEDNDFTLPTATLKPAVGDKYVLLDVVMPEAYRTAAEQELQIKATEWMEQYAHPKVSYKCTFNKIVAKQNIQLLECGDTVHLVDAELDIDEQIRIVKLQKGLTDYWNIQIDLADSVTKTTLERIAGDISTIQNEVVVSNDRINKNTLRSYQQSKELRDMVFDTDGYFDAENIKPLSIETSMLSVGAKSQSFQLTSLLQPNYGGNANVLQWSAGTLAHFTIADNAITEWLLPAGTITLTNEDAETAQYIYARCPRGVSNGIIHLDTTAIKFDSDATDWYFLLGVLHRPIDGVRGISLTYGQTTINGQFITTGVIRSLDGATYFNLNTGEIGGNIRFTTSPEWASVAQDIQDAQQVANNAQTAASNAQTTADGAMSSIDNLQVGGENILNGTDLSCGISDLFYNYNNSYVIFTIDSRKRLCASSFTATQIRLHLTPISLKAGTKYILSFNTYFSNLDEVAFRGNNANTEYKSFTLIDSYRVKSELDENNILSGREDGIHWSYSILPTEDFNGYIQISKNGIADIRFEKFKLEEGTIATQWCPSKNDIDGQIKTAQTAADARNLIEDSITTTLTAVLTDTYYFKRLIVLENSTTYTFQVGSSSLSSGNTYTVSIYDFVNYAGSDNLNTAFTAGTQRQYVTFTTPDTGTWTLIVYAGVAGSTQGITLTINKFMLQYGSVLTAWKPCSETLVQALHGSTDISGGLVMTNLMMLKNALNNVIAGMSGLEDDNVAMWSGGTYASAVAAAAAGNGALPILLTKAGLGSNIGIFKVLADSIVVDKNERKVYVTTKSIADNDIVGEPSTVYYGGNKTLDAGDYILALTGGTITINASATLYPSSTDHTGFVTPAGTYTVTVNVYICFGSEEDMIGVSNCSLMYPSGSTGNQYVSNSVTFALSTYNYHRIFATDTLVKFKITAEVSGSRYTNGSHSETQSGTSVLITEQKKLTLIGNDGFAITIGSTNQFTVQEIADELVMKFRGKMDIPGVLLSGIGFSAGGGTDMWGKTHALLNVEKISQGTYRVWHSIGHSNYSVQITPMTTNLTCCTSSHTSDNFIVTITTVSNTCYDSNFNFVVFGNNHA